MTTDNCDHLPEIEITLVGSWFLAFWPYALLVLDPLPTQSLWQKRFLQRDESRRMLVVAARGDAFLRDPDGATAASLEHFWAMNSEARDSAARPGRMASTKRASAAAFCAGSSTQRAVPKQTTER